MKKTKIHQNLSINNIDNRQINAIIESTKENIVNRKEEGKMKVIEYAGLLSDNKYSGVIYGVWEEDGGYRIKVFYKSSTAKRWYNNQGISNVHWYIKEYA